MKPLINLKSFLTVLLILTVSVALLVAYFRNYSSEASGHEHGEKANGGDSHTAKAKAVFVASTLHFSVAELFAIEEPEQRQPTKVSFS